MNEVFLIMAKRPMAGFSKTRLEKYFGGHHTENLYHMMIEDFFYRLKKSVSPRKKVYLYCAPADSVTLLFFENLFKKIGGINAEIRFQLDGSLFERVFYALEEIEQEQGESFVHLTGSDIPDFPFQVTDGQDTSRENFVVGPDFDGGFYYAGCSTFNRDCFLLGNPSPERVFWKLSQKIKKKGLTLNVEESWGDIDTYIDFLTFMRRSDPTSFKTIQYFQSFASEMSL